MDKFKPITYSETISGSYKTKPPEKERIALPEINVQLTNNLPTYTVTDFEKDPEVIQAYETVMDYFAEKNGYTALDLATSPDSDDDIAETMRDDIARIETATAKALDLKNAPEEVKAAYRTLRTKFDTSEVTGLKEHIDLFLDYGNDALFNYTNGMALGAAVITGGLGSGAALAANVAGRKGASQALIKALNGATEGAKALAKVPTKPMGSAAYVGAEAFGASYADQELQISAELRDSISPIELVTAATVGATLGYGFNKLGSKLASRKKVEEVSTVLPEEDPKGVEIQTANGPVKVDYDTSVEKLAETLGVSLEEAAEAQQDFGRGLKELLDDTINDLDELAPPGDDEVKESLLGLIDNIIADIDSIRDNLQPENIAQLESIQNLVARVGGGQETFEAVVDSVLAASRQGPQKLIENDLLYNLNKTLTTFTSKYAFGKSAGFLSPYAEVSPTAKLLQQRVSNEFALGTTPKQELISEDFAEAQREITGTFFKSYIQAILPLSKTKFDVKLTDEINNALSLALRGEASEGQNYSAAVNRSAVEIKRIYRVAGDLLQREGFIDNPIDNYVPRQWKRSAIENNRREFERLLVEAGEATDLKEASTIVNSMLDKANQLSSNSRDYFFSANRTFENITNDAMFEKFLNNDVQQTFFNYMTQAGMSLAKRKVFGIRNLNEFDDKWIKPIREEVQAAGGSWSGKETERLGDLYKTITGEGVESASSVNQGIQFVQRLALLPLATVSSFTEVLLNFGVAGGATIDGFKAAWKMSGAKNRADIDNLLEAHNIGVKTMTEDAHKKLIDDFGLTPEEAWHEMQEFGLVMEQSLESMADRLAGDMVSNDVMQEASNKFFRVTLLDQWTKFVQNVSFQTGKRYLAKTIKEVAAHGDAPITRRMQSKLDDLAEFGIDANKAKAWAKRGAKTEDPFYRDILAGAARYTNQIILQPTRMSGLKPRAHSIPFGSLTFQLMGYPTAFTNNILKRGGKRLLRDKEIAAQRLLPTALGMTAVAAATNYMRTRGEGWEDKSAAQIGYESLARWGGNGLFLDQIYRATQNREYMGTPGVAISLLGPTWADAANIYSTRRVAGVLGKKVPFYGLGKPLLGEETMEDYQQVLRDIDKSMAPKKEQRPLFKKGGEVNVPQAPAEPDERIDKMTGRPYNQQAGEAFMDEEEPMRSLLARNIQ